jgi:hypothetical protein
VPTQPEAAPAHTAVPTLQPTSGPAADTQRIGKRRPVGGVLPAQEAGGVPSR